MYENFHRLSFKDKIAWLKFRFQHALVLRPKIRLNEFRFKSESALLRLYI